MKKKEKVKFEENESLGYLQIGNLYVQGDDYFQLLEKSGAKESDSERTKKRKLEDFLSSAGYDYKKKLKKIL